MENELPNEDNVQQLKFPVGALLFLIYAVAKIIQDVSYGFTGKPFPFAIESVCVITAVIMFMKKRDITLLISTSVLSLLMLFINFKTMNFPVVLWWALSYFPFVAIVFTCTTPQGAPYKKFAEKLWFIPGTVLILRFIITRAALYLILDSGSTLLFWDSLFSLLFCVAILLTADWIVFPYTKESEPFKGEYYCNTMLHIILFLFTFGIYLFIWVFRTTQFCNRAPDKEQNPVIVLIFYLFVPLYWIYWFYKQGQRLDAIAVKELGDYNRSATKYLIIALIIPIVSTALMQERINKIEKHFF